MRGGCCAASSRTSASVRPRCADADVASRCRAHAPCAPRTTCSRISTRPGRRDRSPPIPTRRPTGSRAWVSPVSTEAAWLADWPGIAARSFLRRYLVRPGDTIYRSKSRGFAAFSNHSLERVIQRSDNWRSIARELRVASLVANSRLHELAQQAGFRQMLVPGSSGVFVGDFDSSLPFIRFDTFLPISAAGRGRCDLLVELAGLLWIGDGYQALMPALFFPAERNDLMDEVLATYERHRRLLERAHEAGEDWFGLALAQKGAGDDRS